MSGKRYPEDFKIEAVKQIVDHGHSFFQRCNTSRYHHAQPFRLDKEAWSGLIR